MRSMGLFLFIAVSVSLAPAQAVSEFQSSQGIVRITFVSADVLQTDSLASGAVAQPADSLNDLGAFFIPDGSSYAGTGDALLDLYLLDKYAGTELRFPAKYSQLSRFLDRHRKDYLSGTRDDRMVACIRDFSGELHVHMKGPGIQEDKQ